MDKQVYDITAAQIRRLLLVVALVIVLGGLLYYLVMTGKVGRFELQPPTPREFTEEEKREMRYQEILEVSPVSSLSGTITGVLGNTLTVEVARILGVDIDPSSPRRTRTLSISPTTEILERTKKTDAEFRVELREYQRRNEPGAPPPSAYTYRVITKEDLKAGYVIMFEAPGRPDIKDAPRIEVAQIIRVKG